MNGAQSAPWISLWFQVFLANLVNKPRRNFQVNRQVQA
jgi:hypothetical protein